jgi:hypothetical protein
MATADIPGNERSRRLDSWKEIAEYLRRDIRTATRWESQGLPLHRVPGGRSVFAFTDEIDAWLASRPEQAVASEDQLSATTDPAVVPAALPAPGPERRRLNYVVIGAAVALIALGLSFTPLVRGAGAPIDMSTAHVAVTPLDVSIVDKSGASRVVHHFSADVIPTPLTHSHDLVVDLDADGESEVLTGVAYYEVVRDRSIRSGELLRLATSGAVRWRFAFDDTLAFADATYSGPWGFADWQVEPKASPARIAVAAHHYTWWASMVSVLDHTGRRHGTFVNPGWIETVVWLDSSRLAISGFNNVRDEGTLALLDVARLDGQAPGSDGTPYICPTCSPGKPLFYATFPRSELNRLTAGRFNRAVVSLAGNQVIVITAETSREHSEASAIYEFDRELRFKRARYSERYWDEHRRLEMEGRISHAREKCPDRDGPPAIHVWDAARGWTRTTAAAEGSQPRS